MERGPESKSFIRTRGICCKLVFCCEVSLHIPQLILSLSLVPLFLFICPLRFRISPVSITEESNMGGSSLDALVVDPVQVGKRALAPTSCTVDISCKIYRTTQRRNVDYKVQMDDQNPWINRTGRGFSACGGRGGSPRPDGLDATVGVGSRWGAGRVGKWFLVISGVVICEHS